MPEREYSTIQSAIDAATPRATIVVCPGTYHEQLVIAKPLTLKGEHATVDETGVTPGFVVPPPVGPLPIFAGVVITSSHVSFSGFTVQKALGEGILAATVPPNASDPRCHDLGKQGRQQRSRRGRPSGFDLFRMPG